MIAVTEPLTFAVFSAVTLLGVAVLGVSLWLDATGRGAL